MDPRRLPGLAATVLAGLLVLGGCADAPAPRTIADPAAAAPTSSPADAAGQPTGTPEAPCTERLRPGSGGGSTLTLTPEVRAEIERLRNLPPDQQAAQAQEAEQHDPALAARLAEARAQVEGATRPCADR